MDRCQMIGCVRAVRYIWCLPPGTMRQMPVQIFVCARCAEMIKRVCVIPVTLEPVGEALAIA